MAENTPYNFPKFFGTIDKNSACTVESNNDTNKSDGNHFGDKQMIFRINHFFESLPETILKQKKKTLLAFLLSTLLVSFGAGRVQMEMSMDSFFQQNEPVKLAYDQFRYIFGGDEVVYLVYEAKDGDILSDQSLKALRRVQNRLLQVSANPEEGYLLNRITNITSLLNANYLETRDDTLTARDFIGENLPDTTTGREILRQQAVNHPDYARLYFSDDFKYGGIMIETDFNAVLAEKLIGSQVEDQKTDTIHFEQTEMKEYALFMDQINEILSVEESRQTLAFYLSGNPVMMANAFRTMMKESGILMSGLPLLIALMLWILFRSLSAVVWPILIILFSLLWVLGIAGWLGIPLSQLFEVVVFLNLAVGVADAVHVLSGYVYFRNQTHDHRKALNLVYRKSGLACFLTSVTTAIGLVSLIFVPITPIRNFAILAAIGVLLAFVFTVFLLPIMLEIWDPFSGKKVRVIEYSSGEHHLLQKFIQHIEPVAHRYPVQLTSIFMICGLFLVWGSFDIEVNTNFVEDFGENNPIRKTYHLIDRSMGGTGNMEIFIDTGQDSGLKVPTMMLALDRLQDVVEKKMVNEVVQTFSLSDMTKESFRLLNEGDKAYYRIPGERNTLAQTLLLFENASPEERRKLVSEDYRMAHISINTKNLGSKESVRLMERIQAEINTIFDPLKSEFPHLEVSVTGQIPLMRKLSDFISRYQLQSFMITLAVISALLLFIFGKVRIGLIAIVPNILPMITIFGLMGFLSIALDMHLMLVAPITIGIAVDDTIHFLTHYRLEMNSHGNQPLAIQNSFREVGQAILFTSIILSTGFMIFLISSSKGFNFFGIFSGVAILTALLADLFLLPSLLFLLDKSQKPKISPVFIK